MERIICSAVRYCEEVYCGYRHGNIYNQFPFTYPEGDDGFITTDRGRFVTREEAWLIAHNAGQIINKNNSINGLLFSEDIY
jgi:hypothetical protein